MRVRMLDWVERKEVVPYFSDEGGFEDVSEVAGMVEIELSENKVNELRGIYRQYSNMLRELKVLYDNAKLGIVPC